MQDDSRPWRPALPPSWALCLRSPCFCRCADRGRLACSCASGRLTGTSCMLYNAHGGAGHAGLHNDQAGVRVCGGPAALPPGRPGVQLRVREAAADRLPAGLCCAVQDPWCRPPSLLLVRMTRAQPEQLHAFVGGAHQHMHLSKGPGHPSIRILCEQLAVPEARSALCCYFWSFSVCVQRVMMPRS